MFKGLVMGTADIAIQRHCQVNLETARLLQEFTANLVLETKDIQPVFKLHLPFSILETVNEELKSKGVSEVASVLVFHKTTTEVSPSACHVDGNAVQNYLSNVSLVLPVLGCTNDTGQYWYEGPYKLHHVEAAVRYYKIDWLDTPRLVDHVSIQAPTLCRVNIPHGAHANGREPRVTCTLRFKANETFEDAHEKLSAC